MEDWKSNMERDKNDKIKSTVQNIIIYLNNDKKYKGKFKYNESLKRQEFDGKEFDYYTRNEVYVNLNLDTEIWNKSKVNTALMYIFDKNRY